VKAKIKVVHLMFLLFLYLHCLACIWFWICDKGKVWVPPLDFIDYTKSDLYETNMSRKYLMSLYNAVLLLGGNEIGPRTWYEAVFVTFIMLLSAIINANIFGEMAVLVELISRKSSKF
jgi:hypothetical protein